MDEKTIQKLLDGEIDPVEMRQQLLAIGRRTAWEPFLEEHHVEPERTEVVNLTVLQHLAIHICVALITPTRQNYAKVLAFVKPFPGGWCRIVSLETTGLVERLISFGQKGGDTTKMNAHPNTDAARRAPKPYAAENGRKGAKKMKGKPRPVPVTWGDKISEAMSSLPKCSCLICHQEMRAHEGNITQHQSGPKCVPPEKYVMCCIDCGKRFRSNNHGTLTRHQQSKSCQN